MDLDALLDELGDLTPVYVIATCLLLLPSSLSYHLSIRPSSWEGGLCTLVAVGKESSFAPRRRMDFPLPVIILTNSC